jgi:hypothetical protein
MPVDIKTEEIIKNITKSLAEVYKSYSESIGDENTANTSIFELNNLRSIAEDGIPYFGVIEVPIRALAGEQILESKGVGAQEFDVLAAIAGGAGAKGEHLTALGDHHGGVIARGTAS